MKTYPHRHSRESGNLRSNTAKFLACAGMTLKGILALFAVVFFMGAGSAPARADLKIDVTRGQVNPMPIAIPDFTGGGDVDPDLGHNLVDVISADLTRSGLFRVLDPKSYIQNGPLSMPRLSSQAASARPAMAARALNSGCGT